MFLGQPGLLLELWHRQQQLGITLGLLLLKRRLLGWSGGNAALASPEPCRAAGISPAHAIATATGSSRLAERAELIKLQLGLNGASQVTLILANVTSPTFNLPPVTRPVCGLSINQRLTL